MDSTTKEAPKSLELTLYSSNTSVSDGDVKNEPLVSLFRIYH